MNAGRKFRGIYEFMIQLSPGCVQPVSRRVSYTGPEAAACNGVTRVTPFPSINEPFESLPLVIFLLRNDPKLFRRYRKLKATQPRYNSFAKFMFPSVLRATANATLNRFA